MKRYLSFFLLFNLVILTNYSFAQPANNDCSGAIPLTIATDEASAIPVTGTTVGATGSAFPATVCSGAWFGDDVWYEFTTDSIVPPNGVTIKVTPSLGSPFQGLGMGVYASCDTTALPIACMSQTAVDTMTLLFLQANTTYKVRMWSGGSATMNSGQFDIIVYQRYFNPNIPTDVVLWGNISGQGDFNGGLNGWTTNADSIGSDWVWEADAQANGMFRTNTIVSPTAYNGAMLFDADFMTTSVNPNPTQPYTQHTAELLSPIIDCTNMSEMFVKFYQSYEALTGDCYFSYSIDSGATFSTPINVNDDIAGNEGTSNPSIKRYYLLNANGNHIQLKFTADMDFYNWIIDDVQLVERERNNVTLVEDFIAIAPTYAMPRISVDTIRFLANVTNTGSNDATNVVATVNVVRDFDSTTVFTTSHHYGNIISGDTVENQVFSSVFVPDTTTNTYTVTYVLSSDLTDFYFHDDTFSYQFEIISNYFDKIKQANSHFTTNSNNSYTYGTSYHTYDILEIGGSYNQDTLWVSAVSFGVTNPIELAGETITIWIEKPVNGNEFVVNPSTGEILATHRIKVGKGIYTFIGNESANAPIYIPIKKLNMGYYMYLEPNMNYIITMEYNASNTTTLLRMLAAKHKTLNYAAADYAAAQAGVQRFSQILDVGNTGTYRTRGLSDKPVPFLRLNFFETLISTKSIKLNPSTLRISPNPATDFINVNIELEEFTKKATLKIYNIQGQIMETRSLSNIKNETVYFDLKDYTSGTYSILIETKNGHSVKRFVVAK